MSRQEEAAVCIVSGGLDSICYSATLAKDYSIYMVTFSYGQRAQREIDAAKHFSTILKAKEHKIVDISFMKALYGKSNALTDKRQALSKQFSSNLVVPIRNAIFLTIASAWAMSIGARAVAYGAHLGDVPHYADCRPEFVSAMADAINTADMDSIRSNRRQKITIISPAIQGMDKSKLLRAGYATLGDRLFRTWSCYSNGVKEAGRFIQCGACESCISRKKAFTQALIYDRTRYAAA